MRVVDVAAAFYHNLQEQIHDQGLPAYQVPEFAERQASGPAFRMPQSKKAPELLAPALGVLRSERLIINVGARYVTEVDEV